MHFRVIIFSSAAGPTSNAFISTDDDGFTTTRMPLVNIGLSQDDVELVLKCAHYMTHNPDCDGMSMRGRGIEVIKQERS